MKSHCFILFVIVSLTISTFSCCGMTTEDKDIVTEVTDSFAKHYVTWHFPDAMKYADSKGSQRLRFMSSNVHDADIEAIRASATTPDYSIDDISINGDSATTKLSLSNVFLMDTLGAAAHLHKSAAMSIVLLRSDNTWKVSDISILHW